MSDDELTYHFVKGQGWVARLGPEFEPTPEPELRFPAWDERYDDTRRWLDAMREWRPQSSRVRQSPSPQNFGSPTRTQTAAPVTSDTYTQSNFRYVTGTGTQSNNHNSGFIGRAQGYGYTHDDYFISDASYSRQTQQRPHPATEEEIIRNSGRRYYPGSNTPEERRPQENQHERRVREYREAIERTRRGRR